MIAAELSYLAAPAIAFLIAAGSPGPATLAVAATAMARGRAGGMALGLGLALGLALWGVIAAAGFGALLHAWAPALVLLRVSGGVYLLYLAWCSARSALSAQAPDNRAAGPSGTSLFRRGLVLNILNPKAVLAWTAVIAIGLPEGAGTAELAVIVAVCAVIGAGLYILYAAIFSTPSIMSGYASMRRTLEALFALAFGAAGLRLIFARAETP